MGVELIKALKVFQKYCPVVPYDSTNPHFGSQYASMAAIHRTIAEHLDEAGLVVIQPAVSGDGTAGCTTILYHESGESIEETLLLPVKKDDPQAACSAISYARRHSISAMLGLVTDEDADGNVASGRRDTVGGAGKPEPGGTGSKLANKPMTQPSKDKLKKAADIRSQEIGDPSQPPLAIIVAAAKSCGYASHIELLESDTERALIAIQAHGAKPDDDDIPF